jgi:hypothetical protein
MQEQTVPELHLDTGALAHSTCWTGLGPLKLPHLVTRLTHQTEQAVGSPGEGAVGSSRFQWL